MVRPATDRDFVPNATRSRLILLLQDLAAGRGGEVRALRAGRLDPKALAVLTALERPALSLSEVAARTRAPVVSTSTVKKVSRELQDAGARPPELGRHLGTHRRRPHRAARLSTVGFREPHRNLGTARGEADWGVIDVGAEDLFPLCELPEHWPAMPGGGKLHRTVGYRYAKHGLGPDRIRLETIVVGSIRYISKQALQRFV